MLRNEPITAGQVRAKIRHQNEEKNYTLLEVYQYHNDQFEKLVGVEFSNGTYKKFKSALKSLKSFLEWQLNKKDVYLPEVDHKFITDYEFYLKTIRHLQYNSEFIIGEELQTLTSKDIENIRISQVRKILMCRCFTDVIYIDAESLKKSEIVVAMDDERWLYSRRKKIIPNIDSDPPYYLITSMGFCSSHIYMKTLTEICSIYMIKSFI